MKDSNLTGATYPLVISNKEFQASPLTDKDYGELDNYIQAKVIEVARNQLGGLSPAERSELLQAAIKAASSSGWGTVEGSKIINTVEGTMRIGWQMIKKKHNVDFDSFSSLAQSKGPDVLMQNIEAIDIAYGHLNLGITEESEEEGVEEAPSESPKSE